MTAALKRLGRYDLIRPLAAGGMAEIYLAAARGMEGCDKLVVIKRMLPRLAAHAEHVNMFLDEARLTSQLSHSNIVHFYDLEARDGEYFIVMELLRGGDVLQLLKASVARARPLPLDAALVIVLGICAALHYAHEATGPDGQPLHIVHRDVSPANVFVTYAGGVKLLDFGVARAEGRDSKTRFGVIKGKLSYVSPEQARGESVDRRSDIFSLSILLWELTTRTQLFRGSDDYAVLQAILEREPTRPSEVNPHYPNELERIVMKGLRRDPNERYQTAQELQIDLEEFALDHKVSTSPRSAANLVRQLLSDEATTAWGLEAPTNARDESAALSALTSDDPTSRRLAVQYIVETRSSAGAQRIREAVENELDQFDKADQRRLCLALAVLLGRQSVGVLLPILEQNGWGLSTTESARIAAAAALGETRDPQARTALARVASASLTRKPLRTACKASLRAYDTLDPDAPDPETWPKGPSGDSSAASRRDEPTTQRRAQTTAPNFSDLDSLLADYLSQGR